MLRWYTKKGDYIPPMDFISVAKVNNIKVIAEGVETQKQWDCLKQMDCDEIQGYLFSKPLVPGEIESNWLRKSEKKSDYDIWIL